tara:strand:- start:241 stop:1098 length:858 start_codon:yes stop_codon:yes gene_type:complete
MVDVVNLIKDLRNKTGAGFLDCKKALLENNNNLDEAIEFLRKKGLAKASKKTSREANEGAVGIYSDENLIVIIKVNSETDFAAKSDTFLNFLDELGEFVLNHNNANISKEDFLNLSYKQETISDFFKSMIAKIGENLILNDLIIIKNNQDYSSYYIHNSYRKNIGKIISLIKYQTNNNDDEVKLLSKNLCMHIAAMKPESIDIGDLDKTIVEKEKNIQKELIISSGKPSNIVEKILDGKMKKFFSEVTLLNQAFILDPDKSINEVIKKYIEKNEYKITSFKIITL